MRFNNEAYEKLYPRPQAVKKVETAVEGFTPSVKEVEKSEEKMVETDTSVETESEVTVENGDGTDNTVVQ